MPMPVIVQQAIERFRLTALSIGRKIKYPFDVLFELFNIIYNYVITYPLRDFVKTVLLLGILGYVPGAWLLATAYLMVRGYLYCKYDPDLLATINQLMAEMWGRPPSPAQLARESTAQRIVRHFTNELRFIMALPLVAVIRWWEREDPHPENREEAPASGGMRFIQSLLRYFVENPRSILKFIAAAFIMFNWFMPFSLVMVYGMYRFSLYDWMETFGRRLENIAIISSFTARLSFQRMTTPQRYIALGTVGVALTGAAFALGVQALAAEILISLGSVAAFAVGMTAIIRDIQYMVTHPYEMAVNHSGKLFGILWGKGFAQKHYYHEVIVNMAPISGQMEASGMAAAIYKSLFKYPIESWFRITSFGYYTSGIMRDIGTSLFFSHNTTLLGDIRGVIGPTSFQILFFMALGCLMGHLAEKLANKMYDMLAQDAQVVQEGGNARYGEAQAKIYDMRMGLYNRTQAVKESRAVSTLYQYRWLTLFTLSMVPVILSSPSGAIFYSLTYGSTAAATLLAMSVGLSCMAMVIGIQRSMEWIYHRFQANGVALPPPPVPLPAPDQNPIVPDHVLGEVLARVPPPLLPAVGAAAQQPVQQQQQERSHVVVPMEWFPPIP